MVTMERRGDDVAARLRTTAERAPDAVALRWRDEAVTYGELDARVDGGCAVLQACGLGPGDRVALAVENRPEFVEGMFAVLRAGGVVVPVNPALAGDEVRHVLADSGARLCLASPDVAATIASLDPDAVSLDDVIVVDDSAEGWAARRDAAAAPQTVAPRAADDLAALVYTSGTTGRPRGAMLTLANLTANQDQSLAGRFRLEPTDVVLLVLPLNHIYALNVGIGASVSVGAEMVIVERFEPEATLTTMRERQVTIVLGAPPMYVAWLQAGVPAEAFAHVRLAVSGAAPLPVPVLEAFRDVHGVELQEGYGLTEAAPSVTSNAMAETPRSGAVGLPLPEIELRLVDDAGQDVDQGDPGEVWVRGPNVFTGYWQDPEGTAEALTDDGWLRTGDIGTVDDDGFLFLVDRKKDLIIVSGFNVYPREVERVLHTHPGVAEAAVVGVSDPYAGEAVKAVVVPRTGEQLDPDAIVEHCRGQLARYKCPSHVELVDALPHPATGKVRRVELREPAGG